jgi:hypothetical protein
MNAAALLKLAGLLEALPPERFDYSIWADDTTWSPSVPLTAPTCGTKACALGWATTMPELGLELRAGDHAVLVCKVGERYAGATEVAAEAFDIEEAEAEYLFLPETPDPRYFENVDVGDDAASPNDEASAKEVAAHIRRFVESRELSP